MSTPGELHRKALRLEWLTIAYLVSAVALLSVSRGSSQAMKAVWVEAILSLGPPIAFLVASRVLRRPPSRRFPYGYHRAVSVALLCVSLSLFALGLLVLYDSVSRLMQSEHPPIGLVEPFGIGPFWLGWLMLPALAYSTLPAAFLGRAKLPLARGLHDRVLLADAEVNRAGWLTAGAAMLGVVGVGLGLWWADAVAASVVALNITRDGWKHLRVAVDDLMDQEPTVVDHAAVDPLPRPLDG